MTTEDDPSQDIPKYGTVRVKQNSDGEWGVQVYSDRDFYNNPKPGWVSINTTIFPENVYMTNEQYLIHPSYSSAKEAEAAYFAYKKERDERNERSKRYSESVTIIIYTPGKEPA